MPVLRLLLLLVVLGGLTLLLLQNWSPVLPLVFLGGRSQALPLAVWILLSVAAGAVSALLIAGLFKTSNYFAQSQVKRRSVVDRAPPRQNQRTVRQEYTAASATYSSSSASTSTTSDTADDWSSDNSTDEDWNFEENTTPQGFRPETTIKDSKTYEVNPDSSRSNQSSSVYSYSSSDPQPRVGKTESIYDADYRVITPPYGSSTNTTEEDEDWGFDDDFEDEDDKNSPLK